MDQSERINLIRERHQAMHSPKNGSGPPDLSSPTYRHPLPDVTEEKKPLSRSQVASRLQTIARELGPQATAREIDARARAEGVVASEQAIGNARRKAFPDVDFRKFSGGRRQGPAARKALSAAAGFPGRAAEPPAEVGPTSAPAGGLAGAGSDASLLGSIDGAIADLEARAGILQEALDGLHKVRESLRRAAGLP